MLKQAYDQGVLLALQEEGLFKEAGATHGLKAIAEGALGKVKNYFTGKGVRDALKDYGAVSAGKPGSAKLDAIMKDIMARVEHSTPPSIESVALGQVGKSLTPYLLPAAGIGAAAATPSAMEAIYPDF